MKTLIATTALALSLTAPAYADKSVQSFFAMGNDSAAETIVGNVSTGDSSLVKTEIAMYNDSAAETLINADRNTVTRDAVSAAKIFFAMGNDSAAETIVK